MINFWFSEDQVKRLKLAKLLKDWGHLESWKELAAYQVYSQDVQARKDIAYIANAYRERGEFLRFPYDDTVARKYMVKSLLKRLIRIKKRKEEI